jgi:hypothetical protein
MAAYKYSHITNYREESITICQLNKHVQPILSPLTESKPHFIKEHDETYEELHHHKTLTVSVFYQNSSKSTEAFRKPKLTPFQFKRPASNSV